MKLCRSKAEEESVLSHGDDDNAAMAYSHADDSAKKSEMDYITSCFTDLFGGKNDD